MSIVGRSSAFLLALVVCVAGAAGAASPTGDAVATPLSLLDIGAPSFTNFSPRDGLPEAVTVAIRTDRDGFVWAASPAGVFRYDGRRWEPSRDPGMAHSVDSLWVDHRGTLWAAFRSAGLARYDGARWHVEDRSTGLPSQQVRRFTETVDATGAHTLWALTWDQGLMVRRDGRWHADPGNDSLPRGPILSMAQSRTLGAPLRQWAGTGNEGLWYRDPGDARWRQWHAPGLDSAQVEYLLPSTHHGREELWISVFGVGLWRLDDQGLRRWSKESGDLPTNELYDLAATRRPDGHRTLWASSRSGLLRLHDDAVQVLDRRHGMPSEVVRGLNAWRSPNGNDVIWLATESGVSRTVLGASTWTTASLMGAGSIGVFGLLVEPDGHGGERLWVGASEDGLAIYEGGRWQHFTVADGSLPAPSVTMIAATTGREGRRAHWVGVRGGELLRVRLRDGQRPAFERVETPWPKVTGESVLDTVVRTFDGKEEQWVGTRQSGVYRLRDGRWTAFRPPGVRGQWRVVKFARQRDASGRDWLWATTDQGLARFDGVRWALFGQAAGLPDTYLSGLSLIPDANDRPVLWMGSRSAGVTRVDISDPHHPVVLPDTLPPPPDPAVYSAIRDSMGRIHVCTNNGVQHLVPADDGDGYTSTVSTRKDGMIHDECNTNSQVVDSHGRFWTGTLGGLAVHDPEGARPDNQPKPLLITGLRIDGNEATADPGVTLPAGTRALEIDFALLSWFREGESRFRTQLLGYEDVPGSWTTRATRSFSALPPGDYRLRVEARDHAGNRSVPVELPITVQAQWWQRSWAYAAGLLALGLLGFAAVTWRTRALNAQRRVLERRVAERTAELDLANARLLELSYRDALTGLANRRRLLERLEAPAAGGFPDGPTALILIDVDHFKAYNDRFGHPAGDEALRGVAAAMRECAPEGALVARYGGEEFACLLPATDITQATALAEQMRIAVAECDIPVPGEDKIKRVTISAGVAAARLDTPEQAHHLMRDADMALYRAKRNGRNRVRMHEDPQS